MSKSKVLPFKRSSNKDDDVEGPTETEMLGFYISKILREKTEEEQEEIIKIIILNTLILNKRGAKSIEEFDREKFDRTVNRFKSCGLFP